MKLTARSYLIVGAVAVPFLAGATAPAGCNQANVQASLAQAKADIATVEQAVAIGSVAFCTMLPSLQADASAILSITTVDARTQAEIAAGNAAATVTCANPTQTNILQLATKIATAKAAVTAALKAAPAK